MLNWKGQLDKLDTKLVELVELFAQKADRIGGLAYISPAPGALLRDKKKYLTSQHAFGKAADLMVAGMTMNEIYATAKDLGFTGIGLYPDWEDKSTGIPVYGVHVDVRDERDPGDPAVWGGRLVNGKQQYGGIAEVLDEFGDLLP